MLDKLPRSVLVYICAAAIALSLYLAQGAWADMISVKKIAEEASNKSDINTVNIQNMSNTLQSILVTQETMRKEYREDNIREEQSLRAMEDRIIRAVKS